MTRTIRRPRRRRGSFLPVVVVTAIMTMLGVIPAVPAHATAAGGWSLEPSSGHGVARRDVLQYVVAEGQVIHDAVTLSNPMHHALTVNLYTANAYNIPNGGAFALADAAASKVGVATWISLPLSHLTVPARTSARIPLTITIPQQASPGELSAGVVAQNTKATPGQRHGNVKINVREALGVRVYLQVAGPLRPGLGVTGINVHRAGLSAAALGGGDATVSYDVLNTGNTRLNAIATAKVVDEFGRTVHQFPPTSLLALLPGSRVQLSDPWPAPHIGRFRVVVTVTAGKATASGQTVVWIFPWVALLLLLAAAGGIVWRRRRRRRRQDGGDGPTGAPRAESIDLPAPSDA